MILANEIAAEYCMANKIPTPYRTQAPKVEEKTHRPAITSIFSNPHYGLGVPFYVHVTSPIRRYTDCLVRVQLQNEVTSIIDSHRFTTTLSITLLAKLRPFHLKYSRRL